MTKQPTTTITEMLAEKERERKAQARKSARRQRQMVQLLEEHVFPLMPQTLASCYMLQYASPGYHEGRSADLTFKPTVDMSNDTLAKRAVGTIDKVVAGLKKGNWAIIRYPEAHTDGYSKGMRIEMSAYRINGDGREYLAVAFANIHETERCHLVEQEVIVAAVAEYTETRMVVKCDD